MPAKENALVDSNHQNIADIPLLMVLAWDKDRLGDLKFFVKDVIKYIPGPGWECCFSTVFSLSGTGLRIKPISTGHLKNFAKHDIPFGIVSFLEGTRITPSKLAKSQGIYEAPQSSSD